MGMRSILRDMRSLLLFSERKLTEAKDTISTLREKINNVMATLRVFKGLVKVAQKKVDILNNNQALNDTQDIVSGLLKDIQTGIDGYPAKGTASGYMSFATKVVSGITRFSTSLARVLNRPNVGPMLTKALTKVNEAIEIVTKQKDAMEKEVELIINWRDAVDQVKNDVFQGDLKGGKQEDQFLFDEIEDIIEGGDVEEIYEAFRELKGAASNYLSHVKRVCRSCAE